MKGFLRKWNEISLIKRIVCGLAMGAVLALLLPDIYVIGLLGTLFVGALKAIAPLLVFSWSLRLWRGRKRELAI